MQSKKPFSLDNEIADIVRELVEAYDDGKIQKIMVITEIDDTTMCYYHGLSFIERLGLGKMITQDAIHFAYKEGEINEY